MSKVKMSTVTALLPVYGKLASNYSSFSLELMRMIPRKQPDARLCFFRLCNIFLYRRDLYRDNGAILLSDLDAEFIINIFYQEPAYSLRKANFDLFYTSKILGLVEKNISYYGFCQKLKGRRNKLLYQQFRDWLLLSYLQINQKNIEVEIENLANRCQWFSDLLILEMNWVFDRWYDIRPPLSALPEGLRSYLSEKYQGDIFFRNASEACREQKKEFEEHFTNYYNKLQRAEREREWKIKRLR